MPTPYEVAKTMIGKHEITNRAELKTFLNTKEGMALDPATRAWCADFVNASISKAGGTGTGSGLARSYANYGTPTNNPQQGDIAVFSRGAPGSGKGHVGFFTGRYDKNGNPIILAGNQSNAVSEGPYDKNRLIGFRQHPMNMGTQLAGPPSGATPDTKPWPAGMEPPPPPKPAGPPPMTPNTATSPWPTQEPAPPPVDTSLGEPPAAAKSLSLPIAGPKFGPESPTQAPVGTLPTAGITPMVGTEPPPFLTPPPGVTLGSTPIPSWQDTSLIKPEPPAAPLTPPVETPGASPTAIAGGDTPAAGGMLAGLGGGASGAGGGMGAIGGMLGGIGDIIGALGGGGKGKEAAAAEAARIEPTHANLAANTSEAGGGAKLSAELMTHLLSNKRRNYGLSLTG